MNHCRFTVGGAAARGDDVVAAPDIEQHVFLNLAQGHVTFAVDDLLEGTFGNELNEYVGVKEGAGHHLCEDDADRALAGAGHTDENDVGIRWSVLHGRRVVR